MPRVGGAVISIIGVKLSWHTGLPTSPLIVCLLALTLILAAVVRYYRVAPVKSRAIRNVAASAIVFGLFFAGIIFFQRQEESPYEHTLHMLESKLATDRTIALDKLSSFLDHKEEWLPIVIQRLSDEDAQVRIAAVQRISDLKEKSVANKIVPLLNDASNQVRLQAIIALGLLGDHSVANELLESANHEEDEEMKIELLGAVLALGDARAIQPLVEMAGGNGLFGSEAFDQIRNHVVLSSDVKDGPGLKRWWQANQHRLEFNSEAKKFSVQ